MVKKGEFVFVYGTLRRGERADMTKKGVYDQDVTFCGKDRITANLYHLGAFPGIKLLKWLDRPKKEEILEFVPDAPAVTGEIFMVHHPSVFAMLDAYEGYNADDPRDGLYDRKEVITEKGEKAWVYIYNGPVINDQLIMSGDWCKNPTCSAEARTLRRA